ncbi:MAG: hypothetical protein KAT37_01805, partial [Candidatus Aenigmarchaeota archaeon]|nr:hypothetical protein [Candidatus Aenigmarchaeota archaeon]
GSYITIVTTVSSDILHDNSTAVFVKLGQRGDEAAYQVEVVPFPSDYFEYKGTVKTGRFDPEKDLQGSFNLSLKKELMQGYYPVVLKTIYHDANMYPFSVLSSLYVINVIGNESSVCGNMNMVEVAQDGSAENVLKIKNTGDTQKEVKIRLYLPAELGSEEKRKTVVLGPKEEKEIRYSIKSIGALPGSSYSILASLEYEKDYHYTSFARGTVKIVEKKEGLGLIWILITLFIVLFVLFVYLKWSVRGVKK